jgi:circadian clock protein KaiB
MSMDDRSQEWKFTLFVAGDSPQSRMAISDLKSIVETYGSDQASVTVTDLFEDPDAATEKDILAIPTLIRESPPPTLRIIGDLSNKERVWSVLSG